MGWGYADWSGGFYPASAASKDYITLYAQVFNTVEIDSTFYGTPREAQVKAWAKSTPEGFVFCPKVPRLITHEKRLVGVADELKQFVAVMGGLGPKRGPMLLQFPPDFTRAELPDLHAFIPTLRDPGDPTARFAVEFRHRSLIGEDVSALLRQHNIALAAADYPAMPRRLEITADFLYLRLVGRHGAYPHHRERQGDRMPDLQQWARALRDNLPRVQAACIQCNDDYEGYAPETANRFKSLLGQSVTARPPEAQGRLF